MKELSVEQKAKRYDEALAMAKECITYIPDEAVNKYMLNMFPELKESEDEKIRKEIIKLVKFFYGSSLVCKHTISKDKMVAWLEKQGEQKSQDKSALEAINEEDAGNVNKIDDCSIDSHYFGSIDKAELLKSEIIKDTWYVCTCTTCTEHTRIWFNKGIAYSGNDILKYDLGFEPEEYQNYFRLWTIEDAKDGDVLVSVSNQPFIYNGKFTELTVGAYCGLNVYGVFVVEKYLKESSWTNNDNIRPATKEQRDILMKEIHRANFKWDADKKELKNCKL